MFNFNPFHPFPRRIFSSREEGSSKDLFPPTLNWSLMNFWSLLRTGNSRGEEALCFRFSPLWWLSQNWFVHWNYHAWTSATRPTISVFCKTWQARIVPEGSHKNDCAKTATNIAITGLKSCILPTLSSCLISELVSV